MMEFYDPPIFALEEFDFFSNAIKSKVDYVSAISLLDISNLLTNFQIINIL